MPRQTPRKRNAPGTGAPYQRTQDGLWCITLTIGKKPNGDPIRKTLYGKTAREAEAKRDDFISQRNAGLYVDPKKATIAEWLCEWLTTYVRTPGKKQSTADEYERVTRNQIIPHLGTVRLQKLRPEQVQLWINALDGHKYAPATIQKAHHILSAALKQAVANRIIAFNPAQGTHLPKNDAATRNPPMPLSVEEQKRFLAALPNTTAGRAAAFMIHTGLRVGECCALTWENTKEDEIHIKGTSQRVKNTGGGENKTIRQITQPKTDRSRRTIPLSASAQNILRHQRNHQQSICKPLQTAAPLYVFATSTGNMIDASALTITIEKVCAAIDIPRRSPHDLRHTFATRLNERGVDVATIAMLMGHSTPATTMQMYIHPDSTQLRRAITLLDSDQ